MNYLMMLANIGIGLGAFLLEMLPFFLLSLNNNQGDGHVNKRKSA